MKNLQVTKLNKASVIIIPFSMISTNKKNWLNRNLAIAPWQVRVGPITFFKDVSFGCESN